MMFNHEIIFLGAIILYLVLTMFNHEIIFISYRITPDSIGNQNKKKCYRPALCQLRSVTRYEFYNYGIADRRPEYVVVVNRWDYGNEVECVFEGIVYNISRIYELDEDLLELTLEKKMDLKGGLDYEP